MLASIEWPSLTSVLEGEVTFEKLGSIISTIWKSMTEHENFTNLWSNVSGILESAGVIVSVVLLALSFVQAFAGRRLLGFQKFVCCLGIGFLAGLTLLHPVFVDLGMGIPDWVIGLVVGAVAALFSRIIYRTVYIVAIGYSFYMMTMGGQLLPEAVIRFTEDNMIISLVVVAIVIVLAIILRKWVELLGTATLGAWCACLVIADLLMLVDISLTPTWETVIITVIAVCGTLAQLKHRRK